MKKEQGNLNYVAMEEGVLQFWQANDIFSKLKAKNKQTGFLKTLIFDYFHFC